MKLRLDHRRLPRGFSLLEVVLVLALLVVLASFVYPALERPFASERLRKGADQLRAEWMRARIKAMTTGTPQVFRFEPETGNYRLEAWAAADSEIEAQNAMASQSNANSADAALVGASIPVPQQLPEGVLFATSQTLANSRATTVLSLQEIQGNGGPVDQAAWSEPIYFYPDGTTSTSRLVLKNEHQLHVMLDLRGLTGVVTVSDVISEEEVPR